MTPMLDWDTWKKGFDVWENATAKYVEAWMRSPLVLVPGGAMLTATMKSRAAVDKAMAGLWSTVGLPTRADQERSLHELHQLQSKLIDLEEQIADLKSAKRS